MKIIPLFTFLGENLAMQRQENEKKDIPVVQKNQASSDVRLEPSFLSIIQSFLVVIFGYIQILWTTTTRPNSSMRTILNCRWRADLKVIVWSRKKMIFVLHSPIVLSTILQDIFLFGAEIEKILSYSK